MSERDLLRAELIAAFDAAGATVVSLADVGRGCPDLLVGYRGRTALCETQAPGADAKLETDRLAWYESWRGGTVTVLQSTADVARVLRSLMENTVSDFSTGPSPHLSWRELGCRDGTPYPEKWKPTRAVGLGQVFEDIRAGVGGPIRVSSAYRTRDYNARVGGSRRSQHVEGRALDLAVPPKFALAEFFEIVLAVVRRSSSLLRGLGVYPTFIHIDIRPSRRLVRWQGKRLQAELVRTV